MALWFAATGPLNTRTGWLDGITGKLGMNRIINSSILAARKESQKAGTNAFLNKSFTKNLQLRLSNLSTKLANKGIVFVKEGSKEFVQENTQQAGEYLWINKTLNMQTGVDFLKDTYTDNDIKSTSILSFATGGLLSQMQIPSFKPNSAAQVDNYIYIAENSDNAEIELNKLVESGLATQEEADQVIKNAKAIYNNAASMPAWMLETDFVLESSLLMQNKKDIELKKKRTDPSFHGPLNEQLADVESKLKTISKKALDSTDAAAAVEKDVESVTKIVGEENIETFDTTEEWRARLDELNIPDGYDADALFHEKDGKIYINKQRAAEVGAITAANHELLHKITQSLFNDPAKGKELVEKFKETLSPSELAKVQKRIDDNYKFKRDVDGNILLDKDGKKLTNDESTYDKEWFTSFSDALGKNEITWSDNLGESLLRLKDKFLNLFKEKGFENADFKTGRDIYNFIRDYSYNMKKGKGIDAKAKALLDAPVVESKDVVLSQTASDKVQNIFDTKGTDGAFEIIQQYEGMANNIANKYQNVPGFDRQLLVDEILTGRRGVLDMVSEYDPSTKVPLAAYVNKFLKSRAIEAANRVLKTEFETDVTEAKGVIATETEVEIQTTDRKKPKITKILPKESLDEAKKLVKERIKDVDPKNLTFKKLKSLTSEVVAEAIGIPVAKLTDPKKNLSKPEANAAQRFILKNADIILKSLPEGSVTEGATESIVGTSTGVPGSLLKNSKLYTKGPRSKKGAGLYSYKKNPNITKANLLEAIGVVDGKMKPGFKPRDGQAIKAILSLVDKNITNELVRTDTDITQQNKVDVKAGGSQSLFSKSKVKEQVVSWVDKIEQTALQDQFRYREELRAIDGDINARVVTKKQLDELKQTEKEYKALQIQEIDNYIDYANKKGIKIPDGLEKGKGLDMQNPKHKKMYVDWFLEGDASKVLTRNIILGSGTFTGTSVKVVDAVTGEISRINTSVLPFANAQEAKRIFKERELKESNLGEDLTENEKRLFNILNKKVSGVTTLVEGIKVISIQFKNKFRKGDFLEQNKDKDEGLKIFNLKMTELSNKNPINRIFLVQMARASSTNQGFILRTGAKMTRLDETAVGRVVEEHNPPVTWVTKRIILPQWLSGDINNLNKTNDWLSNNYSQGILSKPNDNLVNVNFPETMEAGFAIDGKDNAASRMYNPLNANVGKPDGTFGIDPAKMLTHDGNGKLTNDADLLDVTTSGMKRPSKSSFSKTKKNNSKISNLISDTSTPQTQIGQLGNIDKALNKARSLNTKEKGISVFDFDDTLARTNSNVIVIMPDGKKSKIDATEFAKNSVKLEEQGAKFDFSEFNKVVDGKKGPLADLALKRQGKFGSKNIFVLTARPQLAAEGIKAFLDGIGLNLPLSNITGLENGSPQAKANWVIGKAAEGYNDFYFADDAIKNVKAVANVLDQIDVKSKVQQAIFSKTKVFNTVFNDIIESSTGVKNYKTYSEARAKVEGKKNNKTTFFIPPSAEDFTGLIYRMLGKGKKGDAQFQFFKDNLLDPFNRAEIAVTQAKISAANDFKALKRNLKTLPTKLSKQTGIGNFSFGQAARVAVWTRQGMKVPGLSKRDAKKLNDFVNKDKELSMFANELINIQKGKPYPKPGENWVAGTIISDIVNGINTVNRKEYLQEFVENTDIIFSDKNMNKLEAIYGSKYVEALRDSLRRMKSGSNRPIGGSRVVNEVLDWLNNSVGTVMFLNRRSGVLQTISAINFIDFGDNNIFKAGKAFANQPQFWSDFMTLINSPYLTERRDGLKINVSESEIADAVAESDNKVKSAISYLLNKGFVFTRYADSFAIASGGATFYRNRLEALKKQGMTDEQAANQAFEDFRAIAETNQQSSSPSKISQQQASAAGRVILAFANTPMQYARIQKRAIQDLIAGRGDWKSNISKIAYYGIIQNLVFNALQNALFLLMFDDEDEETEEAKQNKLDQKTARIANGMADSLLRGLGIQGAAVSAIKNVLLKIGEESQKKSTKYREAVFEAFDFSPPIDAKVRKLRSAGKSFDWNMDEMKKEGFSLNNPAYLAGGQIISSGTNIPLDRVFSDINAIRQIFNKNTEGWQKVALALGWSTWDVNLPYYGVNNEPIDTPKTKLENKVNTMKKETNTKEQKQMLLDLGLSRQEIINLKYEDKRVQKILELQKSGGVKKVKTPESELKRQFDSIKDENKPDQVKTLLGFGLTKAQIRELRYEKDRVEKILELMKNKK